VATLSFADLVVALSGLKVTRMVHDAPGASDAGQSFVCANQEPPVSDTLMLFTANAPAPLLVSVALRASLRVPTTTPPNLRAVGGSTNAHGSTVRDLDFVMPLAVADTDTRVFAYTCSDIT
jgi:hypothetical protein